MPRNKRPRRYRQRNGRGIVRTGASLISRGIVRCFRIGKQDLAKSQKALVKLARAKRSGEMVRFDARVVKILPDDNEGDRHQRFLVAVDHKRSPINSVLIAHNIDLAPRIPIEEARPRVSSDNTNTTTEAGSCTGPTTIPPTGDQADGSTTAGSDTNESARRTILQAR